MPFEGAVVAVVRKPEKWQVSNDDPGKMASISASPAEVNPFG